MEILISTNANTSNTKNITSAGVKNHLELIETVGYYYETISEEKIGPFQNGLLFDDLVEVKFASVFQTKYANHFRFLIFDEIETLQFRTGSDSTHIVFGNSDDYFIINDSIIKVFDFEKFKISNSLNDKDVFPVLYFKVRGDGVQHIIDIKHNDFKYLVFYRYQHYIFHLMALSEMAEVIKPNSASKLSVPNTVSRYLNETILEKIDDLIDKIVNKYHPAFKQQEKGLIDFNKKTTSIISILATTIFSIAIIPLGAVASLSAVTVKIIGEIGKPVIKLSIKSLSNTGDRFNLYDIRTEIYNHYDILKDNYNELKKFLLNKNESNAGYNFHQYNILYEKLFHQQNNVFGALSSVIEIDDINYKEHLKNILKYFVTSTMFPSKSTNTFSNLEDKNDFKLKTQKQNLLPPNNNLRDFSSYYYAREDTSSYMTYPSPGASGGGGLKTNYLVDYYYFEWKFKSWGAYLNVDEQFLIDTIFEFSSTPVTNSAHLELDKETLYKKWYSHLK
ncbi:hypothetical protein LPB136_13440 [Tenacibaculum todarodis]|uniref:Uncharacterized protein n=1 Tax=Tenacibaculum todarodis TaxID=1850252 RepID=A0A1L3JMJ7_9FLAO|nr:hypothetical protein [Tenacibaculum todarodis]APG66314.1 hypothetical protein LPB136_13440 [Tenacibaculum todarodis]